MRDGSVYYRELVRETVGIRTNQYEKLANVCYDRDSDQMHKVDLFEDLLEELNRVNRNEKALVVNSFYVADDAKQRDKMATEFYALVRREAQEYQERAAYLLDSGCQSPSIMER